MKKLLFLSLLFNLILVIFCWKKYKELKFARTIIKYNADMSKIDDGPPTSDTNFRRLFIEKNDSLYREFYNKAYENTYADAYLIACGYYQATKSKQAKEDIEHTYEQARLMLK